MDEETKSPQGRVRAAGRSARADAPMQSGTARKPDGSSPAGRYRHVYAALDLGTNNCRLLIARAEKDGFHVLDSFSRSVRLGEGLARHGRLSETAMRRAIDAVKICAQKMRRAEVTRTRAIATAACRAAENGADFIDRLREETGIAFDIVSPAEEARLAVAGCAPLIDRSFDGAVVFDIGGGSTEMIWLRMDAAHPQRLPAIAGLVSIPLGVVTLAERFGGDKLEPEAYPAMEQAAMEAFASAGLPDAAAIGLNPETSHMLGTSGTVTTIAGIHLGLPRYERSKVDGVWLPTASALQIGARLTALSHADRVREPCVGADRADLVLPGCAIFAAIAKSWPTERLRIADRGLREGLLFALMKRADREGRRRRRRGRGRGKRK